MELSETLNIDYIDEQYRRWKENPDSVSKDWRFFFEGFDVAASSGPVAPSICDEEQALRQSRVGELIHRYRDVGHLLACMDPLSVCPTSHPYLELDTVGLSTEDLEREFFAPLFPGKPKAALKEIIAALRETYSRSIGVEYMHLQDPEERRWLQEKMESSRNRPNLSREDRLRVQEKLAQSALFEGFLNKKYIAVTRFSLEGADALIPMLDMLARKLTAAGCREIILGMAHRGRLNVQAHILSKPYEELFSEFETCYDPESLVGAGDVKYHQGFLADIDIGSDESLRIFLMNNPSHLEAVDPVVEGFVRGRQGLLGDQARKQVVPLLLHGDAAFAGQGVVTETLNMSQLTGYTTGGTIHVVVNNQIGYTTVPEDARSTRYATDVAKMLMVPIFHVHGEDPEAAVHAMRLAADYRTKFGKDVVVDVICYRRYGHNEGDEPYFTQPHMYDRIRQRPSLHRTYAETLIESGMAGAEEIEAVENNIQNELESAFDRVHGSECPFPEYRYYKEWEAYTGRYPSSPVDTAVGSDRLTAIAQEINRVSEDFSLNPKLNLLLKKRLDAVEKGSGIDWANAEALAFGSLLQDGISIRLSGQDSRRGTFSQRHSLLVDTRTEETIFPLNALAEGTTRFDAVNSHLAEFAVLGFEYGFSLAQPKTQTLWEAQFGDFVNNAQAIIDLFIASGESKWQRLSGLGMLLPHGWEGMGPEHSSARLERFLQLCAEDNLIVSYPSTPAQYFHLLRRQAVGSMRKPFVVMTPKSLLRHPRAVSKLTDLSEGSFREVIGDPMKIKSPGRVVLCSGKIYYELTQHREEHEKKIPVIRVEQFYPFPEQALKDALGRYSGVREWFWVQEEPENMGAWWFIRPRLERLIGKPVTYIGRNASASPATGFPVIYRAQQNRVVSGAFETK